MVIHEIPDREILSALFDLTLEMASERRGEPAYADLKTLQGGVVRVYSCAYCKIIRGQRGGRSPANEVSSVSFCPGHPSYQSFQVPPEAPEFVLVRPIC